MLERFRDSAFLILVVILSGALHVTDLGFYSDDWALISHFAFSLNGAESVLHDSIDTGGRPIAWLYLLMLFAFFGVEPAGYHAVNLGVLASTVAIFYLCLRELNQSRLLALSIAMVYGLLPDYSTDRFWVAASPATISALGYFVSLWADLRSVSANRRRYFWWRVLAVSALALSVLSYEVFIPFFLLNPLLVTWRSRESQQRPYQLAAIIMASLPNLLTIILLSAVKLASSTRVPDVTVFAHIGWFAKFIGGVTINLLLGDFGMALPVSALRLFATYTSGTIAAITLLLGLATFGYLRHAGHKSRSPYITHGSATLLIMTGVLAFVAGYLVFIVSMNAEPPIGIGFSNRIAIAAAVGVSLGFVGIIGLGSIALPKSLCDRVFCAGVATVCASGFLVVNTLAEFWVAADQRQRTILGNLKHDIALPSSGGTVLLDNVCPYLGPASVFESFWDTSGALRVTLASAVIQGDVMTNKMRGSSSGIHSEFYGVPTGPYSYRNLFVYDTHRRQLTAITDSVVAKKYFEARDSVSRTNCNLLRPGRGEARTISELTIGAVNLQRPE